MELCGDFYNRMIDSAHIDRHKHPIYSSSRSLGDFSGTLQRISLCESRGREQPIVSGVEKLGRLFYQCQSIIKQQELSGTDEGTDRQMEPTRSL